MSNVENVIKKSNRTLEDLQRELNELDAYQIAKSGAVDEENNGPGICYYFACCYYM